MVYYNRSNPYVMQSNVNFFSSFFDNLNTKKNGVTITFWLSILYLISSVGYIFFNKITVFTEILKYLAINLLSIFAYLAYYFAKDKETGNMVSGNIMLLPFYIMTAIFIIMLFTR